MNQDRDKLKLSAILSADVVAYSRLMEVDRAWTIKTLEENKTLIKNLVEEYKGRVVDAPGDNLLAEFSSITNAVECAVKIQSELKKKNSKLIEKHRMEYRIGINLGEVFEEEGKIYGSGVNIAARIEGLSKSGGICISGRTYDHVKTEFDFGYEYLGEHEVKNISAPIRVYRLLVDSKIAGKTIREKRLLSNVPRRINIENFIIWIAFTAILSFIISGIVTWNLKPYEPRRVIRFDYEFPKGQQFTHSSNPIFAVSPDGNQLAYSTSKGIYLRSMNEIGAKFIVGTAEKTMTPFFSPDGKWIAYWSLDDLQLKKISILGGTPRPLCNDISIAYYDWGIDGNIYYAGTKGIMRVSDTGGVPETLIELKEEEAFFSPQLLPDGKSVIFTIDTGGEYKIAVQPIDSDDREILLDGHTARYLPTGHLIYMTGNDIKAVPFNIDKLVVTGGVVTIVEDIVYFGPPQFHISNSGIFAYLENISTPRSLVWVDLNGKEKELNTPHAIYLTPKTSPDAARIALSISDSTGKQDIGIWNIDREGMNLLPNKGSPINYYPLWTPDSQFIIYAKMRGSNIGIYRMSSDGTGKIEPLYTEKSGKFCQLRYQGMEFFYYVRVRKLV